MKRSRIPWLACGILVGSFALGSGIAPCQATTIAWWKFDSAANLLTDSSANGYTLSSPATSGVSAVVGGPSDPSAGYAKMDAIGNALRTTGNVSLSSYSQLTIEYFIKFQNSDGLQVHFETGGDYNYQDGGLLGISTGTTFEPAYHEGVNGGLSAEYRVSQAALSPVTSGPGLENSGWHHVAVQYDRTGQAINIFYDYVQQTTTNIYSSDLSSAFANTNFFIGARNFSSFRFNGSMDEFRISSGLLTREEFIQFSPVPEPGSFAMLLFASLMVWRMGRKRRN